MKMFLVIFVLFLLLGSLTIAQAALPIEEAALMYGGGAYEVNPDAEGWLWISDYWGGEIWRLNPNTGEYTRYTFGGSPADARSSVDLFWWVDNGTNLVGRAEVDDGDLNGTVAYLLWQVPVASSLYGTALDDSGRIWVSDEAQPYIYRLAVNTSGETGELCAYSLPNFGMTSYMVFQDPYLLIGDYMNYRLLRLNVDDNTYLWWQLPDYSNPFGMAFDAQGDLWYADYDLELLAELDPDTHNLTSYSIPLSTYRPRMIAIQGMRVWHTTYPDTIGALDTTAAEYTRTERTRGSGTLTPVCEPAILHPLDDDHPSRTMKLIPGTYTWSERSYETMVDTGGWQIYRVPPDGTDPDQIYPNPWGIAYLDEMVYVVDNGRQKLVKFPAPIPEYEVFLPLILR